MSALKVEPRDSNATKARKLRQQGLMPLALTRRDHSTVTLSAPLEDLRKAVRHADGHGRFELQLPGEKPIKVILKSQEVDYVHNKPLSATLQEVTDQDVVRMDVSVVAVGTPQPVVDGEATLVQPTNTVKLRAKMADLPEHLEVNVADMKIGDTVSAHQLELPANVDLMSAPDATIFTVQIAKTVTAEDLTPSVGEEPAEGEEEGGEAGEEKEEE